MDRNLRRRCLWSNLPPELLSVIAGKLDPYSSALPNFRAVCKNWRSSVVPPSLRLHGLTPCKISFRSSDIGGTFLLVATAVYIFRERSDSGGGSWLIAVEQSSSGKVRLFHPITRATIDNFPKNFPEIMSDIGAIKISEGLNLRLSDGTTPALKSQTDSNYLKKLIWCSSPDKEVIVLYGKGNLVYFSISSYLNGLTPHKISIGGFIDDIVEWNGIVWAAGRRGKLYGIDYDSMDSMKVCNVSCVTSDLVGDSRNRLFVDSDSKLCLVVRGISNDFTVYKLESLGDNILFVSLDTCFFVASQHLPGFYGNCIVFSRNCFPNYFGSKKLDDLLFKGASGYLQVGVYNYGKPSNFGLISSFPGYSDVLWPPPQWIWKSNEERELRENALVEDWEHIIVADDTCTSSDPKYDNAGIDVVPLTQTKIEKFQGINVRSQFVPMLKKVWAKYGNIVEGSAVRSCDTIAMAYESVGKVLSILQKTTANKLTEHQAQYLVSTLADLQHMRLKVDWLVPFVEKAFVLHKSKPLAAALLEAEKAKTHADEMRKKVSAEMEPVVDSGGRFKFVLECMPDSDLDKFLGEGIY